MTKHATATKATKTPKGDKEQAALEASAERTAALAEADSEFKDAVAKAGEARKKVLDAYPDAGNIAERAWNTTKRDDDVDYAAATLPFRQKLDTVVEAVRSSGNADVVGLEDFEAEVVRLLKELDQPIAGVLPANQPDSEAGRPAEPRPSVFSRVEPSTVRTAPKTSKKSK